ncbi:MAG: carboxypeptidase-like regulatory domain-containing protein [Thermoanaerobaculia bacterium]
MFRSRALAFAAFTAALATPARPEVPLPAFVQVLGSVTSAARPVGNALVIALNLSSFDAIQTFSSSDGSYTLPPLASGIYKIVAVKQGFLPAIATILPTTPNQRVNLALTNEKRGKKTANQEMWEIRGSLPPDILRELDQALEPPQAASYEVPRIRGQMMSMTAVADETAAPAFAQTALGVQSRIGDSWQLGIRGNLHRVENPTNDATFGTPAAQSSVMSMELRSSPTDSYRVASTQSWWRYREPITAEGGDQADVRAHSLEWEHGDARVQVRYFEQQNLFRSNPLGSQLVEIGGDTTVLQTRRSDIGVKIRVTQESLRNVQTAPLRTADIAANGSMAFVPAFTVHYGVSSRIGLEGAEWAPSTGAEWKVTKKTSFVVGASHKVAHPIRSVILPETVTGADESHGLPRYAYSFGLVSGEEEGNRLSAIMTVSELDTPLRLVFTDGFEQFWDGLYFEAGDLRRDVRLNYRRDIGHLMAIDIATSAGSATQTHPLIPTSAKVYMTGDLQSIFFPTGTTLAISYREIEQPQLASREYRSDRVNFRMAQSLHLPLDLKLLLGMEIAHAINSPFLLDTLEPQGSSKKYIGGLSLNF